MARMSSRERMERMRAEADAAAKEKAAAKALKASQPAAPRRSSGGSSASKPPARVRMVWSLCRPTGKEVQRYPYAQEAEARAEAAKLTAETGRTHFVTKAEVPVD